MKHCQRKKIAKTDTGKYLVETSVARMLDNQKNEEVAGNGLLS